MMEQRFDKPISVAELIELLQQYPQDAEVEISTVIGNYDDLVTDYWGGPLTRIRTIDSQQPVLFLEAYEVPVNWPWPPKDIKDMDIKDR